MNKKEQQKFDAWWRENRTRLISAYNDEIDLSMAIVTIAENAWKSALNDKTEAKTNESAKKAEV